MTTIRGKPGRPRKEGRSILVSFRLREGEHDEILKRLRRIRPGGWSKYMRQVLGGASPEMLDDAMPEEGESDALSSALDMVWETMEDDE